MYEVENLYIYLYPAGFILRSTNYFAFSIILENDMVPVNENLIYII